MAKMKGYRFDLNVRKAEDTDLDSIYRVHTAAIRETCSTHYSPEEVSVWIRRQSRDRYLPFIRRGEIVIAEDHNQRVLGYGHSVPDTILNQETEEQDLRAVQIQGLFVDPENNRKGVGRTLINYLETKALEHGAKALTVVSTLNAVDFYQKCGFDVFQNAIHQVSDVVHLECRKMIKKLD